MHVLILTPVYPHPGNPTEGLFNKQHALGLARAGIRVTIIVCKPWLPAFLANSWERYRSLFHLRDFEERDGVRVIFVRYLHIPKYRGPNLTVASCSRSILSKIRCMTSKDSFDVIQAHSSWPVGVAAPIVADALHCPFVITMHIQDDARLVAWRKGAALFKRMLEKASVVVVVGRPLERFLRPWLSGTADGHLRIIPNGVDLKTIQEVVEESTRKGRVRKRLISVGNLWPVKGIDVNLRALAGLDRLGVQWESYSVVGDGPERNRLERLAQELGIADRVHFKGRLAHRETLKEIVDADIFSLPSWREAFGVVYLEAMACGKPVIGCWGQGAEDIIRHEKDGLLVKPKNVEDLTTTLGHLLKNDEYACALGRSATVRAREFTWERNAEQYLDVYKEVCRVHSLDRN
jgi:glycosyltransferase involved in cell wall biosynthesis